MQQEEQASQSFIGSKLHGKIFIFLNLALMLASFLLIFAYSPAHMWEAGLFSAIVTAPASILAYRLTRSFAARGRDTFYAGRRNSGLGLWSWALVMVTSSIAFLWIANEKFDRAEGARSDYIIDSVYKTRRGGSRELIIRYDYYAVINLREPLLSPIMSIRYKLVLLSMNFLTGRVNPALSTVLAAHEDDYKYTEYVPISEAESYTIVPNKTHIALNLHPGFFGLLWYDNSHTLEP